ncbi:MAG TPA: sulfotransferase [Alphaproteobacteria bacterium]|nr:sulfotransferase [Alphaproteobacteria bacterium]
MNTAPLPSFIIAGASYSGAETLHKLLQANPALYFPPGPPSAFFYRSDLYAQGAEPYRKLFQPCTAHRIPGDMGVQYFEQGIVLNAEKKYLWQPHEDCAMRIKKHCPEAKIIICLRDPLTRAHLQFRQAKGAKIEKTESLSAALEEELNGTRKPESHPLCYLYRNLYAPHVAHWRRLFGQQNILIIAYENLMADTTQTLAKTESFIGVRPHTPDVLALAAIKQDVPPAIAKLADILDVFPFLKPAREALLKKTLSGKAKTEPPPPPLTEAVAARILPLLAEDKTKLEALGGTL